jgi:hypothetical protein
MTVPAKYREFREPRAERMIVALAETRNETDVVFDATVPYKAKGG